MKVLLLCLFAAFIAAGSARVTENTAVLHRQTRQTFSGNVFPQNGNRPIVGPILPFLFPWLFAGFNKDDGKDRLEDEIEQCLAKVRNVALTRLRNGRVYLFNINDKVSWYEAKQRCSNLGMYLATASTQEESNLLIEHVKQMPAVIGAASSAPTIDSFMWTGLNALMNGNGGWFWDSIGQAITFSQWATAQPVLANFCAGINKDVPAIPEASISGWATQDCTDPRGYICELPRSCARFVNAINDPNTGNRI